MEFAGRMLAVVPLFAVIIGVTSARGRDVGFE